MIPAVIGDMRALTDVFVAYIVKCAHEGCGESTGNKFTTERGSRVPEFSLPDGWHLLDGVAYCPRHTFMLAHIDWAKGASL